MSVLGLFLRARRLGAAVVVTALLAVPLVVTPASTAVAANAANFNPGNIISDENFYNANAMSEADIQAFLNSASPSGCGPNSCLKAYSQTTVNKPQHYSDTAGAVQCTPYTGAANESAARIIYKVQRACGVSAKVILVTLQKERGLVGKSNPIPADFTVAMGYGCPDTAACDTEYYGFFNQVWSAAKQFKTYRAAPNFFNFRAGRTVNIQWHPNASCGSSPVHISNAATAALYNYTPYQPNSAAMANLYGLGDGCSSYGNRNFFAYYADWFGSPTAPVSPIGFIDSISASGPGAVRVRGWTFTSGKTTPIAVHVYVDGAFASGAAADGARGDVANAYPSQGRNHGFDHTFTVAAGTRQVCVYAVDQASGGSALLACKSVTIAAPAPVFEDDYPTDPAAPVAIYRFWSSTYNGHFYTRSKAERDRLIATSPSSVWAYEGTVYGAYRTQVAGTVPLYRFWSSTYNGHFYTISEAEKNSVIASYDDSVWKYETIAYYVYPANSAALATRPVARFWGATYNHHFYTANASEAQHVKTSYPSSVWQYETDAFRVPVAVPTGSPLQ